MTGTMLIGLAALLALVLGPLLLGATGAIHARRGAAVAGAGPTLPRGWRLTIGSALLYTLAFNLTFFIQELFLVLPKALTPGLRPTLFHNNHRWDGENPLANLFQGTGALAILLSGLVFAVLLRRCRGGSTTLRLLLFWMAYSGLFMALPQVVIGALSPSSDVGMAMGYLGLGAVARTTAALLALAAIPFLARWLAMPLLALAGDARAATAQARSGFVFRAATLPALIAIVLIVPFRIPREWVEVVVLPMLVTLVGVAWIQAGAWRLQAAPSARPQSRSHGRSPRSWFSCWSSRWC